ncbi:MAG: transposase [Chloroflexi bacterium]|nr:transposase [Chloroflexota bacterium]
MLVVEGHGLPIGVVVESATPHEVTLAQAVIDDVMVPRAKRKPRRRPRALGADKGFDSRRLRAALRRRGIRPRIPQRKRAEGHRPRRGRPQAPLGRTRRWVVERTFAWMDNCRRLVVRYERKLENFKAFCLVAFIQWSLNRLLRPVAAIAPYY